jgi:hypothetical protein
MTDERSAVHLGHLDLGSGFALVQRDDSGWKAAVFKRGVRFSRVSDKLGKQARAHEQGQIKRAGTVDDIEPKAQNQDSKVGEPCLYIQDVFTFTLVSS